MAKNNNHQPVKAKTSYFSSSSRKDPSFEDIEDIYFTVKTINKKKELHSMEPYFEDETSSVCSDIIPMEEINKIYNLLKHQSKDELDPEELKIETIEQENLEASSDEDAGNNQQNTTTNLHSNLKNSGGKSKLDEDRKIIEEKNENWDPASNSFDSGDRGSTNINLNNNILAFMVDEDHFGSMCDVDHSGINKSKSNEETKDFDKTSIKLEDAINDELDQTGMTPRAERVSSIVQEVTTTRIEIF